MNSHVKLVVPDMSSHFGGLVTERAQQAFKSTWENFEVGLVKFQFDLHKSSTTNNCSKVLFYAGNV